MAAPFDLNNPLFQVLLQQVTNQLQGGTLGISPLVPQNAAPPTGLTTMGSYYQEAANNPIVREQMGRYLNAPPKNEGYGQPNLGYGYSNIGPAAHQQPVMPQQQESGYGRGGGRGGDPRNSYAQYEQRQQALDMRQQQYDDQYNAAQQKVQQAINAKATELATQGIDPNRASEIAGAIMRGEDITPYMGDLMSADARMRNRERETERSKFLIQALNNTQVYQRDDKGNVIYKKDAGMDTEPLTRPVHPDDKEWQMTIDKYGKAYDQMHPAAVAQEGQLAGEETLANGGIYKTVDEQGRTVYKNRGRVATQPIADEVTDPVGFSAGKGAKSATPEYYTRPGREGEVNRLREQDKAQKQKKFEQFVEQQFAADLSASSGDFDLAYDRALKSEWFNKLEPDQKPLARKYIQDLLASKDRRRKLTQRWSTYGGTI